MKALADLARVEVVCIMGALFLAVALLGLTGRLRLAGLLQNKCTGAFDPMRLQLLTSTLVFALVVLTHLGEMRVSGRIELASGRLLYLLGGSQGLYLFAKYFQFRSSQKGE